MKVEVVAMRRALLILFTVLTLASLTSCSGGETKIVYRDRPTTTVAAPTTTTLASSVKYNSDTGIVTVRSDYFGFTAKFPSFGYSDDVVNSYGLEPTSTTTEGGKRYHNNIVAATKGDKLIYCDTVSDACKLMATFGIGVYPDNEVNRAAVAPASFMDCTERTFTGVSGQDCYWGDEGDYYRDVFIHHNGWIYNIEMNGPQIFGEEVFDSFVRNFGFNGT